MAEAREQYRTHDLSVPNLRANFYSIALTFPLVALFLIPYLVLYGFGSFYNVVVYVSLYPVVSAVILASGIILHEFIHLGAWVTLGKKSFKAIRFGFDLRTLTPYVHCPDPMPANIYRAAGILPAVLLGFIPALWGLADRNAVLLAFGLFFTLVAGGDFLILWRLRKIAGTALVADHPSQAGCYVLEPLE